MKRPDLRKSAVGIAAFAAALAVACGGQIDEGALGPSDRTPTPAPTARPATPTPESQRLPTPTPVLPGQPSGSATGTPTFSPASAILTATAMPPTTPTPVINPGEPTPPSGSTPTPPPGSTPVVTPTPTVPRGPVSFGPVDGALEHLSSKNGDDAEQFSTGVDVQDFMVSADFVNPYSASQRDWNYGYWIRVTERPGTFWTQGYPFPGTIYEGLVIVMDSTGDWRLFNRTLTTATQGSSFVDTPVAQGEIPLIKRDALEVNKLTVAALGERGWLFVNGDVIAELDLSSRMVSGDMIALTGVGVNDEYALSSTRFRSLTVVETARGSSDTSSGVLHSPAEGGRSPDVSESGDFVFETEISVPSPLYSGPWSWSVQVNSSDVEAVLTVNSAKEVMLTVRSEGGAPVTTVSTTLSRIDTGTNAPNHVQVSAVDGRLGFMINGFALPSIEIDEESGRNITLLGYVQGEPDSADRVINHADTRVWQLSQ